MKGHSNILNLNYTRAESDILTTEDKVNYTTEEMKLLKGIDHEVMRDVHKFKKFFNGEVVR